MCNYLMLSIELHFLMSVCCNPYSVLSSNETGCNVDCETSRPIVEWSVNSVLEGLSMEAVLTVPNVPQVALTKIFNSDRWYPDWDWNQLAPEYSWEQLLFAPTYWSQFMIMKWLHFITPPWRAGTLTWKHFRGCVRSEKQKWTVRYSSV